MSCLPCLKSTPAGTRRGRTSGRSRSRCATTYWPSASFAAACNNRTSRNRFRFSSLYMTTLRRSSRFEQQRRYLSFRSRAHCVSFANAYLVFVALCAFVVVCVIVCVENSPRTNANASRWRERAATVREVVRLSEVTAATGVPSEGQKGRADPADESRSAAGRGCERGCGESAKGLRWRRKKPLLVQFGAGGLNKFAFCCCTT